MRIVVKEDKEIVEFWLTNEEKNNIEIKAAVTLQCKEWKKKNYYPVIFQSGGGDLKESIEGLLRHSCELAAKEETAMDNAG